MTGLIQDLRYALRQIRKAPGLIATAVITLALGIGANTAIFSALNAVVLRPLPYENSSRLVWLTNYLPRFKDQTVGTPDFLAWRDQNHSFSSLAAYDQGDFNLTGGTGPERIHYVGVTASLFTVLGIQPQAGRAFRNEENIPGAAPVAILSHGLWQRSFGADRFILGKKVALDGTAFEVIGVMPPSFVFPDNESAPDVLIPLSLPEHLDMATQPIEIIQVIGRLRPGITIDQAKADIATIQAQFVNTYPPAFKNLVAGIEVQVLSLHEHLVGDVRHTLLVLLAAVLFLLLIACANTANLQLAKAIGQSKELGVRAALGASRFRLARQFLTESMLVSLLGAATGILLAYCSIGILHRLHPQGLPQFNEIVLDASVLAFGFVVAVLSGILSGVAPALVTRRSNLNDTLKESSRTLTDAQAVRRVRKLLVVSEVSLATILLVGSGLFIRTFVGLQQMDPGFDPHQILTLRISLPGAKYPNDARQREFFEGLIQRLSAVPEIRHAGTVSELPLTSYSNSASVVFEGRPTPPPGMRPWVPFTSASSGYFRAMGIPLIQGRDFDARDGPDNPRVVLVTQAFVQRFMPGESAIGKRIQTGHGKAWRTIVGVVGDVRHLGLPTAPAAEVFGNFAQDPNPRMSVVVRVSVDPLTVTSAVRQAVLSLDQELPIFDVATMEQRLANSIAAQRFNMWLLTTFGMVALTLGVIGIYGIVSFYVVERTHEIGIRMALGAEQSDVLRLVLSRGTGLALAGVSIGLVLALALSRFLSSMLFGVRPNDAPTFLAVSVVLAGAACVASYIPARCAANIDPMVALRYE